MRSAALISLLLPAFTTSCVIELGDFGGVKASKEDTLSYSPSTAVSEIFIDTFNGGVTVAVGEGGTVQGTSKAWASSSSTAKAQERLATMNWSFAEEGGGRVVLRMGQPASGGSNNAGASAKLTVPAGVRVLVDTSNGPVEIIGAFPYAWVDTSNAPVRIEGATDVDVDTSNAPVIVVASGKIQIDTSNAPVTYNGSSRDFLIDTSNAPVEVGLQGDWNGEGVVDTSNGSIRLSCSGLLQCELQHRTSNGKLHLDGPAVSGAGGKLELDTSNGSINVKHGG